MKCTAKYILFLIGITILFSSITASAHTMMPTYPCDEEGAIEDIEEIPCVMRKKGWEYAAMLMERWFKENHGQNYIINIDIARELSAFLPVTVQDAEIKFEKNNYIEGTDAKGYLLDALNADPEYSSYIKDGRNFDFDFVRKEEDIIFSDKWDNWDDVGCDCKNDTCEKCYMNWIGEE